MSPRGIASNSYERTDVGHIRGSEKLDFKTSSEKGKNKKTFNLADTEAKSFQLFLRNKKLLNVYSWFKKKCFKLLRKV